MRASIAIIGAGMGGLAAGIYAQKAGYETEIFEQAARPGGQCASWTRSGYTFDGCIHHLFGTLPDTPLYEFWEEIGAMPRELAPTRECVAVADAEGRLFTDHWDPDRLEAHMKELTGGGDSAVIEEYARMIPRFARNDFMGEMFAGSKWRMLLPAARLAGAFRAFAMTMRQFGERFEDPFLRRAFPLLEYSLPEAPYMIHLVKHAYGMTGNIAWPVGASERFVRSIEKRYLELGGRTHYGRRVSEVVTRNAGACGIRLDDGTEVPADTVISNADGRATIMNMLGGRFVDAKIAKWVEEPDDETPFAVQVFLGVDRDLSGEPSALVQLLDRPVSIAGHPAAAIELQTYGYDPTMAPEGKGVIKADLTSKWSYWHGLRADRKRYRAEKEEVASRVIGILDDTRFPGIRGQVEVTDVATPLTWQKYVGGTHGYVSYPKKEFKTKDFLFTPRNARLPGLKNFYLVGSWATATGALFANALSGRRVIGMMQKA